MGSAAPKHKKVVLAGINQGVSLSALSGAATGLLRGGLCSDEECGWIGAAGGREIPDSVGADTARALLQATDRRPRDAAGRSQLILGQPGALPSGAKRLAEGLTSQVAYQQLLLREAVRRRVRAAAEVGCRLWTQAATRDSSSDAATTKEFLQDNVSPVFDLRHWRLGITGTISSSEDWACR